MENTWKTYTDDQVIIGNNGECFRHDKPSSPKMKVQGLEEGPENPDMIRKRESSFFFTGGLPVELPPLKEISYIT